MNTKYPTNGRYATLGDIVHEYRNYATVETIDSSGNRLTESLLDYIQDKPYELVWFDNVYSNTEKSEDGKSMKIILHNSSSNYDRYILANELLSNSDNSFPFYIATANEYKGSKYNDINNIATSYYFNYKTSNGESTLLYIFNEIKNLVNNNDELKNLFGNYIVNCNDYTSFDFIKLLNNYTISNDTSTYRNILTNAKNESKKYTSAGNNVKLYFYIKLYNNICRFVPGKLSALTLSKVTKITYKLNEPVYRCDIGINDLIDTFNVTKVLHDQSTTLPAGQLSGNTKMTFIVSYNIKYEHSSSISSGKYSFSLTFDTINALTNDNNTWKSVRFILPNDNTEYKYEDSEFPYIERLRDTEGNLTYGSLTNFLWPADTSLCVTGPLENYSNNSEINIENSNNSKYLTETYEDTYTNYNQNIHKYFGSLKIHTAYKTTSEKDIQDTSFTCTVPIYRHKNYFIDETKDGNIESADIYIYLDPIYKDEINLPNIKEKITLHDSNYELSNLKDGYIVPYEVTDNTFSFISILLKRGIYRTFLSGTVDAIKKDSEQYVNDKDCNILSYTNNQWAPTNDITLTPVYETSDTEKLYKLLVNKSSNNIKYFRIGIKNNNDEYNSYIYLKKSSNITSSHKLNVKLFKTIDNYDNSLKLLVYNLSNDEKDYYTYNTIGFNYTGYINILSFSNLYIQFSCIKSTTLFNNKWIYKPSDIYYLYYAYKDNDGTYQSLENDLFSPCNININSTADSKGNHLYMSLSPISIIYDETTNPNILITYILNNNTTINNKGYEYISNNSDSLSIIYILVIYKGDISTKDVNGSITLNDNKKEDILFNNTSTYNEETNIVLNRINKVSCVITEDDKQKNINITWDTEKGTISRSSGGLIINGQNTFTLTELKSGINITITANNGYYLDKESEKQNSYGTMQITDTINSDSTDKTYVFKEGYQVTCDCTDGECKFSDYEDKKYTSIYTNSGNKSKITITPSDGYEIKKSNITSSKGISVLSMQSNENMTIEITKITQDGTITVKCTPKSTTDTTTP